MPVAFTQEIISQQWNAALLRSVVTNKMIALGYLSEGATGDDLFFSLDVPTTAPKDKGFIRLNIGNNTATNIRMQQWFSDSYTANALTNPVISFNDAVSGSANIGYGSNEIFPIRFCTFKSSEIAALSLMRSDNNAGLATVGFLFPSVRASWWDNNSMYAFCGGDATFNSLRCYAVNQLSNGQVDLTFQPASAPSNINPGGTRDLIRRIIVSASGSGIVVGASSTDLGVIGAANLNALTQIQDQGQTWVNIRSGSSLAVRIL